MVCTKMLSLQPRDAGFGGAGLNAEKPMEIVEETESDLYMTVRILYEDSFYGHQGYDLYDPDKVTFKEERVKKLLSFSGKDWTRLLKGKELEIDNELVSIVEVEFRKGKKFAVNGWAASYKDDSGNSYDISFAEKCQITCRQISAITYRIPQESFVPNF